MVLRPRWFLSALILVGFLPAGYAQAQLIESAYPADVPGFDTQRGVSVTSRIQTDTAWQQIPLSVGFLHPEVTQSVSYDSAVLVGERPSWIIETAPSVTFTSTDAGSTIGAVASVDTQHYLAAPDQSETNWTAALGGTFDIADCKVTTAAAHFALHENDTALDAAQFDQPLAYAVDALRLSAVTPASRLTLQPSLNLTRFLFGSATIGGEPAPQSYRDRLVGDAGLILSYGIMGYQDPNQVQMILRGGAAHYPNQILGQPPRDSIGGTVLFGVEHDLDGIWGWRFAVGLGGRKYRAPYQSQVVPLAEAAVTWQSDERTTWHAALFRRIEDASNEGIGGYVATIGGIGMDHELQRSLILHLGTDLDRADYTGGTSQTITSGRLGVLWLINTRLRLNTTVTLSEHRSSGVAPYLENAALLSMTAGL